MADSGKLLKSIVVLFVGVVWLYSVVFAEERKITIVEKHCPKKICKDRYHSIFHVVAESSDKRSAIHYLWSVFESPTIIVAYFKKPDVNVSIDWKQVLNKTSRKGIHFTERYEYITALVIPAIYEFQDPKDELYYTSDKVTNIVKHAFNQADWKEPEVDYKNNMTTFKASMLGGHVIFQCNASFSNGQELLLPQQQFSSNSTIFTLTLDHLTKLNATGHTRFIFELFSFIAANHSYPSCVEAHRLFDDEYTPAVFKTIVVNNTGMSYCAWKPVAYIDKKRSLDNQVPSYQYYQNQHRFLKEQCENLSSVLLFSHSIVNKFDEKLVSYGMNISFGQQKDGWYDGMESSNYLSWTAVVGYGSPVRESLSTVVLIIIIVGFGAPMLLILVSIVYVIARKLKANKATSSYGIIN